jgi:hypothetical protein
MRAARGGWLSTWRTADSAGDRRPRFARLGRSRSAPPPREAARRAGPTLHKLDEWRRTVPLPYTEEQWALLAVVYADYDDHGAAGTGVVLRAILGRKPRTPAE